ncbi:MAG: MazG family protein [Thalassolituus oleivorans]|jgi:MazG family protein
MAEKIFDPSFTEQAHAVEAYADFVAIVRQLRRDCPWDREQTHESVRHLLIEEAYETVDAIDKGDWQELQKELGDLLLHVVFHSVMAEEDGRFTMKDVIDSETEKLVVRHPHVFGDTVVDGVSDVLTNWEQIKMKEGGRTSVLDGVPSQLPGLLRAHRIQEKAAGVGFDFPEASGAWEKVAEEIGEFGELADAATGASPNIDRLEDELGDVFFALVNYARFKGLNAENALRRTNAKFAARFQHIEARMREQDRNMADADLEEMDRYWDEAKAKERG